MKKYRDLTSDEYDNLMGMLVRLKTQIGTGKLAKMADMELNPNDNKIVPDHYYYVSFDNPVTENPLYYIGVSDDQGRLWLIKKDQTKYTYIKKIVNKSGWYRYAWFAFNILKDDLENNAFSISKKYLIKNVVVKDIQDIKTDLVKYDEYVTAQEQRHQEYLKKQKEADEEYNRQQEEQKKKQEEYNRLESEFYKSIEGYADIGYICPGSFGIKKEYIDIYNKIRNSKDPNKWRSFNTYYTEQAGNRGRTYSDILANDEYKVYFTETGDSSD